MKQNTFVFVVVVALCAALVSWNQKSEPEFSSPYAVVTLLGENFQGETVQITPALEEATMVVLTRRLGLDGSSESRIARTGPGELTIQFEENFDEARFQWAVALQGKLEFKTQENGAWVTKLGGEIIKRASAGIDDRSPSGSWMIFFDLTSSGQEKFAELTTSLVGKPLGIFFDGNEISAPIVQTPITGEYGTIQGNFTKEEAESMAQSLNSGELPVKLSVAEMH